MCWTPCCACCRPPGANRAAPTGMQGTACRPGSMRWRVGSSRPSLPLRPPPPPPPGIGHDRAPAQCPRCPGRCTTAVRRRAGRTGALVLLAQQNRRHPHLCANLARPGVGSKTAPHLKAPAARRARARPPGADGPGVPMLVSRHQVWRGNNRRFLGASLPPPIAMPSLETLITFLASAAAGLTPGPDNLFVLVQSAQRGWRAGMAVVLGLCVGLVVHTAAVALGLAAVFAASAMAFTALKWRGAAYLAYLAWQALRAPAALACEAALTAAVASGPSGRRMVARGAVMNLTNPKVLKAAFAAVCRSRARPGGIAADGAGRRVHPGYAAGVWRHRLLYRGVWRAAG